MLSMQMKSGDYVTIGENVVVQIFKESGPQFRISIKAPREIPIVRGKVLERNGNEKPEGLRDKPVRKSPSDKRHAAIYRQRKQERQEERSYRAKQLADAIQEMADILNNLEEQEDMREKVSAMQKQLGQIACASEMLAANDAGGKSRTGSGN